MNMPPPAPMASAPMSPPPPPPPPQKSSAVKWILIGCGGVAFLGILSCGGCFLVGYLVLKAAVKEVTEKGVTWIKENEQLKKEIGPVTHVDTNYSWDVEKRSDRDQVLTVKFKVTGERGKGVVKFILEDRRGRGGRITGVFIREDGKEIPIGELNLEDSDDKGDVEAPDK